jgi:toxin ParE1/3/4
MSLASRSHNADVVRRQVYRGCTRGLARIHSYICKNDSHEGADYVAREIVRTALTLHELPERGAHPPELLANGIKTYRQLFFKPYRILYKIRAKTVYIAVIADGRREMRLLLMRRLLDG